MASNEYIIDSIKKVARDTLPPKSSLLLFGSRARHEEKANSDWDILILLDKPQLTSAMNTHIPSGFWGGI